MAKLTRFSEDSTVIKPTAQKGEKIKILHYSKLLPSPFQYRDKGKAEEVIRGEVISLAMDIKVDNGIIQPLIVRKIDTDLYEIVVGHNRLGAIRYLVEEEGMKQFEFLPCVVRELTDVQAKYMCCSSNNMRPKTDWEIMHELEVKKEALEAHPEDFPHLEGAGRIVEKLARDCNMKRSTVGEYLQISKNLSDKGMEAFQSGELNKSAAVAISALPHQEQDQLIDEGLTKHKDIKAYKEEKVEKTVCHTAVTDTEKPVKILHSAEKPQESVPKFGTDESETADEFPDRIKAANTDMEVVEEDGNQCTCSVCDCSSDPAGTYVFYGKPYCVKARCLEQLLFDLEDTGVITIERLEASTKGNIIRS